MSGSVGELDESFGLNIKRQFGISDMSSGNKLKSVAKVLMLQSK